MLLPGMTSHRCELFGPQSACPCLPAPPFPCVCPLILSLSSFLGSQDWRVPVLTRFLATPSLSFPPVFLCGL